MIKITTISPTKSLIEEITPQELDVLKRTLTYSDNSAVFNLKKLKQNKWLRINRPETFENRRQELETKLKTCMVSFDTDHEKYSFHPGSIPYLNAKITVSESSQIKYPEPKALPWKKPLPFDLYPYQKQSVERLIEAKHGCVELCTGCHAKGQEILMYNGSLKKVEDIEVGDLLMGPDSTPRKVLKLHRGTEEMAKIIPVKGDPFVVNMGHILSLQKTNNKSEYRDLKKRRKDFRGTNPIVNISVKDYLKQTISFKHRHKLYRTGVDFQKKDLKIDPYILGLWLGDGASSKTALTTMDAPIENVWNNYAEQMGLGVRVEQQKNNKAKTINIRSNIRGKGLNKFLNNINFYKIRNNKHIPSDYKTSSKEDRLALLAGLIDSDGSLSKNCYEITQKNKVLAEDIVFVARSLGFAACIKPSKKKSQNGTEGLYYRISIFGNISEVPVLLERKKPTTRGQIKNVLRTGFSVEQMPKEEYFGFEVDKDNLYVMGDFTVTHNSGKSAIILTIARQLGLKTVVVTPSESIFLEMLHNFETHLGKTMVGAYGGGKKKLDKKITICISKSLSMLKPGTKEYDFFQDVDVVIGDESHTLAAETLENVFHGVLKNVPYRFFLSGTQVRGDGKDELLQAIIGKKIYELTTKEAVNGGYICPVKFCVFETFSPSKSQTKDPLDAKREHLLYNPNVADIAAKIANSSWSFAQESTLILVEELSQIKMLVDRLKVPYEYVHSASKKDAEKFGLQTRKVDEAVEMFNQGLVKVLIGTSCIATGTNIYPTHNTINLVGGSSEVKTKQGAVGRSVRLLEKSKYKDLHKPKPVSKIYDFRITNSDIMEKQLQKRISMYEETSDDIRYIKV